MPCSLKFLPSAASEDISPTGVRKGVISHIAADTSSKHAGTAGTAPAQSLCPEQKHKTGGTLICTPRPSRFIIPDKKPRIAQNLPVPAHHRGTWLDFMVWQNPCKAWRACTFCNAQLGALQHAHGSLSKQHTPACLFMFGSLQAKGFSSCGEERGRSDLSLLALQEQVQNAIYGMVHNG